MVNGFEDIQKISKDSVDNAVKSFGAVSKGAQAIAVEATDYAKRSYETGAAHLEKLMGVKTLDKAFELNTDYAKSAYETFVAQATKMGEMYTNLAKEAFKPIETAFNKATPVK